MWLCQQLDSKNLRALRCETKFLEMFSHSVVLICYSSPRNLTQVLSSLLLWLCYPKPPDSVHSIYSHAPHFYPTVSLLVFLPHTLTLSGTAPYSFHGTCCEYGPCGVFLSWKEHTEWKEPWFSGIQSTILDPVFPYANTSWRYTLSCE